MNEAEAAEVAEARLSRLRRLPYSQLVEEWLGQPRSEYATASSGRRYQVEVEATWDDRPDGRLRIWVMVDDGGLSETRPVVRCFIVAPAGSFVDE